MGRIEVLKKKLEDCRNAQLRYNRERLAETKRALEKAQSTYARKTRPLFTLERELIDQINYWEERISILMRHAPSATNGGEGDG